MRKVIRRALGWNNDYQQLPDIGNYEYDLFVAYAEGDEDWVHGWLTGAGRTDGAAAVPPPA